MKKVFRSSIAAAWRAMTRPEKLVQLWGANAVYRIMQVEHELQVGVHLKYAGRFAAAMQGGAEFSSTGVKRLIDQPNILKHARMHVDKQRLAMKP